MAVSEANERVSVPMIILERYGSTNIDHNIDRRFLCLSEPVRVGRAIGKQKPSPENAMYECRVLSRSQAIIWFENNRFFVKDTKSSNGTYVNNSKLGPDEEAEIFTDDIVQFGIDVAEANSKECALAHTCVVVRVKCTNSDGVLSTPRENRPITTNSCKRPVLQGRTPSMINSGILIEELVRREGALRKRLSYIDTQLISCAELIDQKFEGAFNQDDLLCRIHTLEQVLAVFQDSQYLEQNELVDQLQATKQLLYEQTAAHKLDVIKLENQNSQYKMEILGLQNSIHILEDRLRFLQSSVFESGNVNDQNANQQSEVELNTEDTSTHFDVPNGSYLIGSLPQMLNSNMIQIESNDKFVQVSMNDPCTAFLQTSQATQYEPLLEVASGTPVALNISEYDDDNAYDPLIDDGNVLFSNNPFMTIVDSSDEEDEPRLFEDDISDTDSIKTLTKATNVHLSKSEKSEAKSDRSCSPFRFNMVEQSTATTVSNFETRSFGTITNEVDFREKTRNASSGFSPWMSTMAVLGVILSTSVGLLAFWNLMSTFWIHN